MTTVENATMIGKSVRIHGELSGSEDLVMDGELHGTIKLPGGRLTIGAAARVHGDIAAKDVVILGRLDGDIRATGRVELRASALMQGNVYAGSLSIEENAEFRGQVDPSRAQEPIPERTAPVSSATPAPRLTPARPAADGLGSSVSRGSEPLAAAPVPGAAAKNSPAQPTAAEPEDGAASASLFAETQA
jgi:cytoskeletal protein CcmA (bactofilin family)